MKLYDIVAADGTFVDSMSRIEILERFGISKGVFQRYLDNGDLLEGKYQINDYDCDIKQGNVRTGNYSYSLTF